MMCFPGEYSNLPMEELIDWINADVPEHSSMAGG